MWKILTLFVSQAMAASCDSSDTTCFEFTDKTKVPDLIYQSSEAAEWNKNEGDDTCWVSKVNKTKASPSLRNCYGVTEQACCNFVEDASIGDTYSSFIPSPCADDFKEIQLFMCIACNG